MKFKQGRCFAHRVSPSVRNVSDLKKLIEKAHRPIDQSLGTKHPQNQATMNARKQVQDAVQNASKQIGFEVCTVVKYLIGHSDNLFCPHERRDMTEDFWEAFRDGVGNIT